MNPNPPPQAVPLDKEGKICALVYKIVSYFQLIYQLGRSDCLGRLYLSVEQKDLSLAGTISISHLVRRA